ncbi:hypothetical protein [Amycolatopsis jejuensis]|uniref:hypothetical protein n=1 Tax=Amycolatopsis jejuensis TaxID=330084 RepID=UPI000524DD78|nr:hypothetical protein [Amycolatopsis jejuensis]
MRKLLAAAAMPAIVGLALTAAATPSAAATTYNFRLSNFSGTVANICVYTGAGKACSGRWGTNKSEVFKVQANSPSGWHCYAEVISGTDASSVNFNRNDVKECILHGTLKKTSIAFK